jgi:spore coat polysaccharide biosynthesis predicted glycosyltransferase SpsG
MGFGHLTRVRSLRQAIGSDAHIVLRGPSSAQRHAAASGWTRHPALSTALARLRSDLVVIDDPSPREAARLVRTARRAGVPVALVRDLGLNTIEADVTIDASLPSAVLHAGADLQGPAFAILDPAMTSLVRSKRRRRRVIVVALGGGVHGRRHGVRLARAIRRLDPNVRVELAPGFTGGALPDLPDDCAWLSPDTVRASVASAAVAVTGGGVTLLEACAVGTPTVAFAVTTAQHLTAESLALSGAAIDAGRGTDDAAVRRAAAAAVSLLHLPRVASAIAARAATLVDGRGAARVARRLRNLAHMAGRGGRRAA